MAAYISVPRDLSKVKSKIFFNLTKRQLICFSIAAAVGVPLFFLVKRGGNVSLAALTMIGVMLPFFFLAMYEKDGRPLEKILMNIYRQKILRPGVRVYRTRNMYRVIQDEIYEKEVLGIESDGKAVQKGQRKAGRKKTG